MADSIHNAEHFALYFSGASSARRPGVRSPIPMEIGEVDEIHASPPSIFIENTKLEVVHSFDYLGSTVTDNLFLDAELDIRLGKAATTLGRVTSRVWNNSKLSTKTKMAVYNACVIRTLLHGSDSWPNYSQQEKRLDVFHLRSLRKILGIAWQGHVTNDDVLSCTGVPSMYSFLRQRRIRWLGHIG